MSKLRLFAGPCVIENEDKTLKTAAEIIDIVGDLPIDFVFKASFDKANRTSAESFRGVGIDKGLKILQKVKDEFGVSVVTDVHVPDQVAQVASVVDVVQVPAFLCRQTDLLVACGESGKEVLIKKGQFLHPEDMSHCAAKVALTGNSKILLCERGSTYGYRELVVDFKSFSIMKKIGFPVIFDATHSVQVMGGAGGSTTGYSEYVSDLARAAVCYGVDGVFIETLKDPLSSPSDGNNMLPLEQFEILIKQLVEIYSLRQSWS